MYVCSLVDRFMYNDNAARQIQVVRATWIRQATDGCFCLRWFLDGPLILEQVLTVAENIS